MVSNQEDPTSLAVCLKPLSEVRSFVRISGEKQPLRHRPEPTESLEPIGGQQVAVGLDR